MDTPNNLIKTDNTCTLSEVETDSKVKVTGFACDNALRSKLCSLGITPGTELDLKHVSNALCVKVKECNLVLDEKVASEILCEPLQKCCCRKRRRFNCFKNIFSKSSEQE